jgi:DNA-binding NarL/FixJ family response regulator
MNKTRVLIADDQMLMRDGLKTILSIQPDIEVVATAKDGKHALEEAIEHKPDVILMDIRMPIMDGVECTKHVKEALPETVIIILTTFDDDEYIFNALANGASGYLLKDMDGEKLVQAIRDAMSGSLLLPGRIAQKIALNITSKKISLETQIEAKIQEKFSAREYEIATLLVQGFDSKQIAQKLFLSQGTVKNLMSSIYKKTGSNDRTKVVLFLKEMGFE